MTWDFETLMYGIGLAILLVCNFSLLWEERKRQQLIRIKWYIKNTSWLRMSDTAEMIRYCNKPIVVNHGYTDGVSWLIVDEMAE